MDTVYKILESCEVKKVGERQYEFTASTADMDRDGEVIDVSGWDLKNFKKNPVVMFAHDYRSLPIGKATKIGVRDNKLVDVVEFPPEGTYEFADIVQRLVDTGYLKTQSVGFIPKKWEDGDFDDEKGNKPRRTYTKQELLEISIVAIPSNPNALMNAVKEGVITQKQFNAITEGEPSTIGIEIIDNTPLITKPEETDEYIRIPVDRGDHEGHRIRTIDISQKEGIKAIYCGTDKVVMTYLFLKDKGWTMEKARAWVKEHEKSFEPHAISQSEIIDEIDYLKSLIKKEGLSLLAMENAISLSVKVLDIFSRTGLGYVLSEEQTQIIERISGGDIPVKDIVEAITASDILESIKRIMEVK